MKPLCKNGERSEVEGISEKRQSRKKSRDEMSTKRQRAGRRSVEGLKRKLSEKDGGGERAVAVAAVAAGGNEEEGMGGGYSRRVRC